jgi:hypothetical protein
MFILSIVLLCWNTGCLITGKEIAWGLGGLAYISKEILDRKHEKIKIEQTKRGLDLTEKGLNLQERKLRD